MGKQEEKERWPGFPERLREAFQRGGYWKNDRPDIMRFGIEHGIHVSYLYKYVGGDAVPDRERLMLLGSALGVRAGWLLLGDEEAHGHGPSRGKAQRRQGRRTAGSLLLALTMGAAGLLGWPRGSVAGETGPLSGWPQLSNNIQIIAYRTLRWLRGTRVRALQPFTACLV